MVQDSTNVNTKVHTLKASTENEMHIKAQSLESRVDKMMQEMDNVQKLMHMPSDQGNLLRCIVNSHLVGCSLVC